MTKLDSKCSVHYYFVCIGASDLICHLLQPDSSRRATLDDVMHHPWITKDGTHHLIPYEYTPPDPITQNLVKNFNIERVIIMIKYLWKINIGVAHQTMKNKFVFFKYSCHICCCCYD